MALKLNRPEDVVRLDGRKSPLFKEFYGQNVAQMPKLVESGRVPVSTARLMQRRIDVRSAGDVNTAWIDNYFDMGDAIAYHSDGRLKVVLDSQTLREMTPENQRVGGALALTDDVYKALEGEEFTRKQLEGHVGNQLTRDNVKANPVWRALARDQALLDDYADYIFTEGNQRFGYETAMGIYPDSAGDTPKMRALFVDCLEDRSDADGRYALDFSDGRLVGVAPEARDALGRPVQQIREYTMGDVQAAEAQMKTMGQFARPETTDKVTALIEKL